MATEHALTWLDRPQTPGAVCVVHGEDRYLRQRALATIAGLGGDPELADRFEAATTQWRDIADALSTRSLFGGGDARLVILTDADKFVSDNRKALEKYLAHPSPAGRLVLDVEKWPGNTKLAKQVAAEQTAIDCGPPLRSGGRGRPSLDTGAVQRWIAEHGRSVHQVAIAADAAATLLELIGPSFGRLDQELAKLNLYAEPGQPVGADLVERVVGGWRAKTIWQLIDAAVEGNSAEALLQLDRFLQSGEHPLAAFGAMASPLRRFAAVLSVVQRDQRAGKAVDLNRQIKDAGVKPFLVESTKQQLKQLGSPRIRLLLRRVLDLDLALKGSHSAPDRARWALEQLILEFSRHNDSRARR